MKRVLTFCALVQALVVSLEAASPRPINDGISNTILLAEKEGSYAQQGGSAATAEIGETPVAGGAATDTVWYRYKAPTEGRISVALKGDANLRAELRLPGNPATTIPLQTIADGTSNTVVFGEKIISADLQRGQEIYLVVDSPQPFDFRWRFSAVVNDHYEDAETLEGAAGTVRRSDRGATLDSFEIDRAFLTPVTWYQWTAPSTGSYYVDLVGSRQANSSRYEGFGVRVFTSMNGVPATQLGSATGNSLSNGTTVNFGATEGVVYYFACFGETTAPNNQIWLSWYPDGNKAALAWAEPEYRVFEGGEKVVARVLKLRGDGSGQVSYGTMNIPGTPAAVIPDDYDLPTGLLTLNPGTRAGVFEIPIKRDAEEEPTEGFRSMLFPQGGAFTVDDGTSNTILITEAANEGACGFVQSRVAVREGETVRVEVRRLTSGNQQIAVGWQTIPTNGAVLGEDCASASGTAILDAGQLSTFIEVPVYSDGTFEGEESFGIQLTDSPLAGITDGTSNTITVGIEDRDYFVPKAGRYCGLIQVGNWGALVNWSLSNGGVATGSVDYQGVRYPFRGPLDGDGALIVPLQRGLRPPLGLRIQFGEGWNDCAISVRDPEGAWADGICRLLPYDGKRAIAPQKGQYTLLCQGDGGVVSTPFVGVSTVLGDGSVRTIGRVADNAPVSFGGAVALGDGSVRGECAFSVPLYAKRGTFYGTIDFGGGPQHPGDDSHQWWLKPWRPTDAIYPALPFQPCVSNAIPFTPPAAGQPITSEFGVSLGDGSVRFINGGTVVDGTSNTIQIGERFQVEIPTNPNNCSIKINPKNGTFTGKLNPPGGTPTTFYGAFIQGEYGYGLGFYLGDGRAGEVVVEAD